MIKRISYCLMALLFPLLLNGCSRANAPTTDQLSGRMLLWSAWSENEEQTLQDVIARFTTIHPAVRIQEQRFASVDEMITQFRIAAQSGLGPDLLIAPSRWTKALVDEQLIDTIDDEIDPTLLERFLPSALEPLRYNDHRFGLPESLNTMVLYYDRSQVTTAPTTLDGLLAEAAAGHTVAISASFQDAFWGIQAFGGKLFDEEGRVILDRGGFANWLAWLKDARDLPGILLDTNRDALRNRFMNDGIAYYIGASDELNTILEGVGEENLGVATLPVGPLDSAAPLLNVEGLYFSAVSSANQRKLALELAQFITNTEQQSLLMRQARHAPANTRVRINPRLYPTVANIVAEARNATPLVNTPPMESVLTLGSDAYNKVLEGVLDPVTAAIEVTAQINAANGFSGTIVAEPSCRGIGTITLAHALSDAGAKTLTEVIRRFRSVCPAIIIKTEALTADALLNRLLENATGSESINLVIGPQEWLYPLATANRIANITAQTDSETLQHFRPIAMDGMRYQGGLFGLPLWLNVDALYFNRTLVSDPARTLDEIASQASAGLPITLDLRFRQAFWGIGAFGGEMFDTNGNFILGQGGFAEWLQWLQSERDGAGIQLSQDPMQIRERFAQGQSAYLVGDLSLLDELNKTLGTEKLGVATLPTGTHGDASPLVMLNGIFIGTHASEAQSKLALEFALFATNQESQQLWMHNLQRIPVNSQVELSEEPVIAIFAEQLKTARLLPNLASTDEALALGKQVYSDVFEKGLTPEAAVALLNQ